jgi:RNA polymerase sigma-70 factor, ECF subfamily
MSNTDPMDEITELLKAWSDGDKEALERLVPLVDDELRKIAHAYMRKERTGHILQTTALVNEALLKLIREKLTWENRKQFYAFVAIRMRHVLIDHANKERKAEFKGLDEADIPSEKSNEMLLLDEALKKLEEIDQRKVRVVECRYFIGLTIPDTAKLLGIAPKTVERDWEWARAWLYREMT